MAPPGLPYRVTTSCNTVRGPGTDRRDRAGGSPGAALQQERPQLSAFRTQEPDQSRPRRAHTLVTIPWVGATTEHSPCRTPQGPLGPARAPHGRGASPGPDMGQASPAATSPAPDSRDTAPARRAGLPRVSQTIPVAHSTVSLRKGTAAMTSMK